MVLGESHDYDEKWNVMWEMHVSDLASNHKRYSQSSILSFVYSSKQAAQHSSIQAFFHSPFNLVIYMVWVMLAIVQCGMEFAYMTNLLFPILTPSTALSTTTSTTISATLSNTIITSYHVYLSTLLAQFSCLLPECWVFAKIMIICSVVLLRVRCATRHFFNADNPYLRHGPLVTANSKLPTCEGFYVFPSNTNNLLASFTGYCRQ